MFITKSDIKQRTHSESQNSVCQGTHWQNLTQMQSSHSEVCVYRQPDLMEHYMGIT